MTLPVHLVPSLAGAAVGTTVEVRGEEAHHAVAVRRLRVGEAVALTDGRGLTATGSVATVGKRLLVVEIDQVRSAGRGQPRFTVVQAIPKGERGDLAVELLTEVGVDQIVPWAAARCVAVWRGERAVKSHARWAATAREAAKQSRRSWFPIVAPLASTADVAARLRAADLGVVLHEAAEAALPSIPVPVTGEVVVVVGPEGGLTAAEVGELEAAGGVVLRLGVEVLRTSTAGLAAVSGLLVHTPRWL